MRNLVNLNSKYSRAVKHRVNVALILKTVSNPSMMIENIHIEPRVARAMTSDRTFQAWGALSTKLLGRVILNVIVCPALLDSASALTSPAPALPASLGYIEEVPYPLSSPSACAMCSLVPSSDIRTTQQGTKHLKNWCSVVTNFCLIYLKSFRWALSWVCLSVVLKFQFKLWRMGNGQFLLNSALIWEFWCLQLSLQLLSSANEN